VKRVRQALSAFPVHLVIVLIGFVWILPTMGIFVTSFRPRTAISGSGWWTVFLHPFELAQFTLQNYVQVLNENNMWHSFLNSLMISIPGTLIPLLLAAFAAYAFAWMKFPGRDFLLMVVIGLIVVPLQITFIPALRLFVHLGLNGTFFALWLAHAGYGLPLLVYMLRNFMGGLPSELFESAFIDGASHWTAFVRLVLPLSVPALASMAIFQFLWVWNDLLVALIYVGGSTATSPVTLTIANMIGSHGENWQLLTAAAFVSIAVPLVVFLSLQRFFVRGILAGSVKG